MTFDPRPASARLRRASRPGWAGAAVVLLAFLLGFTAACSVAALPSASPGGSGGPGGSPGSTAIPTSTPVADGIAHLTGATDVLLRLEQAGGFVRLEASVTDAPSFTLYGDGTVIFRDPTVVPPEPVGGVSRSTPFQTVHLGEARVQALLGDAIGPGGLAVAIGPYMGKGPDLPTTTFTISAEGETKSVSVIGLSPDVHPQDAAIVGSLARLADRLAAFGSNVAGEQPFVPTAYRGTLIAVDQPFGPVVAWPWATITPDDFDPGENELFLTRTMTPADVAALGIPGAEGGILGVALQAPGKGKIYTFALRPLLPDETK
jgi:hypothetical protein